LAIRLAAAAILPSALVAMLPRKLLVGLAIGVGILILILALALVILQLVCNG